LNSGDQWLNGALCDVRIYNRVITGAEVSTLFSGGNVSSGLVGEYFAPTATSASANDQSGGGHNGSFNGSPTLTTGPSALSGLANGSVVSTSPSYTFTLNSNVALVANFTTVVTQDTVAVSASPSAGGTVSGGGTFAAGSSDTVTATANNGYQFVNWTQNGSVVSTSPSYTFTVNSNVTLVANFTTVVTQDTVAVSASPSAGGTVSGGGTFAAGSSVTVTATANSGYSFCQLDQHEWERSEHIRELHVHAERQRRPGR